MKKKTIFIILGLAVFGYIGSLLTGEKTEKVKEPVQVADKLTYAQEFEKKQFNETFGYYKPVKQYLKTNLNDPSSLEFDKTWNRGMNADSTFSIKTTYRAKNSFNAMVLETIYCDIGIDGSITNVKIE